MAGRAVTGVRWRRWGRGAGWRRRARILYIGRLDSSAPTLSGTSLVRPTQKKAVVPHPRYEIGRVKMKMRMVSDCTCVCVECVSYHVPHFDGHSAALHFVHVESNGGHQSVTEAACVDDMNKCRLARSLQPQYGNLHLLRRTTDRTERSQWNVRRGRLGRRACGMTWGGPGPRRGAGWLIVQRPC